jgi:hypothetical protein
VRPLALPLLALPLLFTACVNTDATVFVDASIESATAAVTGGALGATVEGKIELKLHLGPRASGPSKVELGAFAILDAKQEAEITAVVLGASTTEFPVTVDLDSDVAATLPYSLGSKTVPVETKAKLCDAAGVVIRGTIQDSLLGGSSPFFSPIIHPTGCM